MDFRLRGFLDEDDVELALSLKNDVDNKRVFPNVLQKHFEIFHDHS